MTNIIRIYCKNDNQYYDIERGTPLIEIYDRIQVKLAYPTIVALVDYKIQNLNFLVYKPKDIEFLDATSDFGLKCYIRTLCMILSWSINRLYPNCDIRIEQPLANGFFCSMHHPKNREGVDLTPEMIADIKQEMHTIVKNDYPISTQEKQTKELMELFKSRTDSDNTLFETLGNPYCRYYQIEDYIDYYTDALMPSTGYAQVFDLEPFRNGFLLRIPKQTNPNELEDDSKQIKGYDIYREYVGWNKLMQIRNVGDFNVACKSKNKAFEMIKLSEALHEKKVIQIADHIANKPIRPKFVLISGPSSSGKTTFSKRLDIQLLVNGIRPVIISMDNYFVNREDTPRDENGDWDFEHINALDLPLFRKQLADLVEGKEIDLPYFNFETGKREFRGEKLRLNDNQIVVLEGLHALNPQLLPNIPAELMYKVYVNCITTVNLDNHNWIPTDEVRLIRRIIRDYYYRGYSARETIARNDSVRRGEKKWIYPFQDLADDMFNSALLFELAALKKHAEPILEEVPKYCDEYTEAHRLLKFLSYFVSIPEKEIPLTSFLREFVGGSAFHY